MSILGLALVLLVVGVALILAVPDGAARRAGNALLGVAVAVLVLLAVLAPIRQVGAL